MTPRQARILACIRRLTVDGVSPTYREIRADLGIKSAGHLHDDLARLRRDGVLTFTRARRSIIILDDVVSPLALAALSDEGQMQTLAVLAGQIASRRGDHTTATALRNIADALLTSPKAQGRAA